MLLQSSVTVKPLKPGRLTRFKRFAIQLTIGILLSLLMAYKYGIIKATMFMKRLFCEFNTKS